LRVRLLATGSAVPPSKITNRDLESHVETSHQWIVERTGIEERGCLPSDQGTSDLATAAARAALDSAGIEPSSLDLIVCATCTADMPMPSAASLIQRNLRVGRPIPAYDINAACAGFVYALEVTHDQLRSGRYRRALLIGADAMTRLMDYTDRGTCVLFGDGAGAVILEASENAGPETGIVASCIRADGEFWDSIHVPGGGSRRPASPYMLAQREQFLRMNGRQTFKLAVQAMEQVARDMLKQAGWAVEDVNHVIVHQANLRIIEAVAERLGLTNEQVPVNVASMGNTSAGSIPVLLDECNRAGKLKSGDRVLCVGFGAGLTWGGVALYWG
jgi:3-oxoacyl-[acyl-carrier-protein] synthase III